MLQRSRRPHMNLSIKLDQFNIKSVIFMETNNNKVIKGLFSNVIYTDSDVIFSGIYIQLPNLCDANRNVVTQQMTQLENKVMEHYKSFFSVDKEPFYTHKFHFPVDNSQSFILKISGLWESDTHYGVNHKIIQFYPQYKR